MNTLLPTEPKSYSQLIKYSFWLYKASFIRVWLLSFLLALVIFVPRFLVYLYGDRVLFNPHYDWHFRLFLFIINLIGLAIFISILGHFRYFIQQKNETLQK